MKKSKVMIKGQIVIPIEMREKYGFNKGAEVTFIAREQGVEVRPMNRDFYKKMAWFLGTGGKLTKALLDERQKDKEKEDKR